MVVCHVDRQAADFAPHDAVAHWGSTWTTIPSAASNTTPTGGGSFDPPYGGQGWGDRLLLALDTTAQRLAAYGGEIGLRYLLDTFYPRWPRRAFPRGAAFPTATAAVFAGWPGMSYDYKKSIKIKKGCVHMIKLPEPAKRPTMYFVGVTTGQSSIMKVFPVWAKALGLDAEIKGIDLPSTPPPRITARWSSSLRTTPCPWAPW